MEVLINNAGIGVEGHLALTPEDEIGRALAVNLEGPIHLTRACLKGMIAMGRGKIVMVGSVNGRSGHAGVSVYSAAKAGLEALVRSLAPEVGPQGVRVNALAAGFFDSDMTEAIPEGAGRTCCGGSRLAGWAGPRTWCRRSISWCLNAPDMYRGRRWSSTGG